MNIYTEAEILKAIQEWKLALSLCSTGKSYTIDGRTLTRFNLSEIREHLKWLSRELSAVRRTLATAVRPMVRR